MSFYDGPPSTDGLGDMAFVDYADLLPALQKDLQLNLGTDVMQGTATPLLMSQQARGQVSISSASYASGGVLVASWSPAQQGTYLKASSAGLTCMQAGLYLFASKTRFDNTSGGNRYAALTLNGTIVDSQYAAGTAQNSLGAGAGLSEILHCSATDVVSVNLFQDTGASQTLVESVLTGVYLGPGS